MEDHFKDRQSGLSDVATLHVAITPSDSTDLPIRPRALYCIASGNVAIRDEAGTDITYPVVVGQIFPFRPVRVLATGTTATVVSWT